MLRTGVWTFREGPNPRPPSDWAEWRRERLQRCIDMAMNFLCNGSRLEELRTDRFREVTKQRAAQDIVRGIKYFVDIGFLNRVKPAKTLDSRRKRK